MNNTLTRYFQRLSLFLSLAVLVTMTGCAATQDRIEEEDHSGYLPDYSMLESDDTEEGNMMRWLDKSVTSGSYSKIMLDSVQLYPPEQLDMLTEEQRTRVEGLLANIDQTMLDAMASKTTVVTEAGPGVLRLRPAITGMTKEKEGFKAYEVLPIAAVISGAKLAAGKRNQVIILSMETKLEDSVTGKLVGANVRKGVAETGENNQPDPDKVMELFSVWAKEGGETAAKLIK